MNVRIRAVFVVGDQTTVAWLQTKTKMEQAQFSVSTARVVADDIFPAIEAFMREKNQLISLSGMGGPWDPNKVVEVILETFGQHAKVRDADHFLTRTGSTSFGGKVAVAVACDK